MQSGQSNQKETDDHRTLNVQRRIMYSVNLKKNEQSELTLRNSAVRLFKIDKAQRHQYSKFDVGRSMFDVQSVDFSGKAE